MTMTLQEACRWIVAARANPDVSPDRATPESRLAFIQARCSDTLTPCRRNAIREFKASHGRPPTAIEREDALLDRAGFRVPAVAGTGK